MSIKNLTSAVRRTLATENWYAALGLALALPDICADLEDPTEKKSSGRYRAWFDRYLAPQYTRTIGWPPEQHVFLSGSDCYALRCAFLHQGRDEITEQRARQVLERFQFRAPGGPYGIHRLQTRASTRTPS